VSVIKLNTIVNRSSGLDMGADHSESLGAKANTQLDHRPDRRAAHAILHPRSREPPRRPRIAALADRQYLWQILSCVLATAAVIAVSSSSLSTLVTPAPADPQTLTTLFRQRRATSAALFSGNQLNRAVLSKSSWSDNSDDAEADADAGADVEKQTRRQSRAHPRYLWTRVTGGPALSRPDKLAHTISQLEDRFLRIALKISCYPVALIVVNGLITSRLGS
jgi:hypothetical protein